MTRLSAGDGLDIDPSETEYDRLVTEWLAGSYASGWDSLKMAFVGSTIAAAQRAVPELQGVQAGLTKATSLAEVSFVADFNYKVFLLGPCLSCVLFSSLALESFLRISFQVSLELRRSDEDRRRGFRQVPQ